MAVVIFFAAASSFGDSRESARPPFTGGWFLALALGDSAELGLAVALQEQTLAESIGAVDKVSGSVYLGLLLVSR